MVKSYVCYEATLLAKPGQQKSKIEILSRKNICVDTVALERGKSKYYTHMPGLDRRVWNRTHVYVFLNQNLHGAQLSHIHTCAGTPFSILLELLFGHKYKSLFCISILYKPV